jgi:hypothetical protein
MVGSFAADARVYHAGNEARLRQRLGYEFTFLYVGRPTPAHTRALENPARFDGVEGIRFVAVLPESVVLNAAKVVTLLRYRDDMPPLPYNPSVPRWYAIRADGHIAGTYDPSMPIDFAEIASRCLGGARLTRSSVRAHSEVRSASAGGAGATMSEQRTTS